MLETLESIFSAQAERERVLACRHPWVPLLYNWMIGIMIIALFVSFVLWGIDIKIRHTADAMTAEAIAVREQEQQAIETARLQELAALQASEDYIISQEAKDCAKALYGIRLFVEKYGYNEADLITYLRSAFNRADARGKSLHDILSEEGQYLAWSDSNTILAEYEKIAGKAVREWHEESTKPCDLSYQFAELTPSGIWLKNDLHADGYARRWRAQ